MMRGNFFMHGDVSLMSAEDLWVRPNGGDFLMCSLPPSAKGIFVRWKVSLLRKLFLFDHSGLLRTAA